MRNVARNTHLLIPPPLMAKKKRFSQHRHQNAQRADTHDASMSPSPPPARAGHQTPVKASTTASLRASRIVKVRPPHGSDSQGVADQTNLQGSPGAKARGVF
jgi:hypothetical protein